MGVGQIYFKRRVIRICGRYQELAGQTLYAFDEEVAADAQDVQAVARFGFGVVDEDGIAVVEHAFHRITFDGNDRELFRLVRYIIFNPIAAENQAEQGFFAVHGRTVACCCGDVVARHEDELGQIDRVAQRVGDAV